MRTGTRTGWSRALVGLGLAVSAVWLGAATPTRAAEETVIGVSLLTLTNPFFVELGNAIKDEAAKNGMKVILTAGEFDVAKQKNQVADFIVKRVGAIVLCPCDSKAIGTSIAEANKAVVADPAMVNTEPYAGGWFYKIKLSNPAELNAPLTPEQYQAHIGEA